MDDSIPLLRVALEGRYRVERELGIGGTSTVYLAHDLRNNREVALKVLRPDLAAVVAGQRFLGEIHTTARLQHPHILPLFDSGEAAGLLYYVMPYVKGESLRAKLDREGELPIDEALGMMKDLALALDYAHRNGVVHRDIKPANVLLQEGKALISDFGIALAIDAAGGTRFTGTGQSVGTPHYMSPEQCASSREIDRRSDIYSLGCVLHEMLTGEPVFSGRTPRNVLAQHLTVKPIGVRKLRGNVEKGVEDAILKALEKSPADRFSTMADFAEAIETGAAPSPVRRVGEATMGWVRAHPLRMTAAVLALVGTAVVYAPWFFGPAWTERPSSVAVLPFHASSAGQEEVDLVLELSDAITRELQRWDGVVVASDIDLAGPRRDLGLTEATLERIGDGTALARRVEAEAMLTLTVERRGGDVSVQANLFDSRSGRRVGEPLLVTGPIGDISRRRLIAPVVAEVLGFGDAPEPRRAIGAGTRDPDAAEAYLRGRDALERSHLDAAETFLTQAVQSDSTFASALSFLGQAHFWRGVEAGYYFLSRGSEISRLSTAAMGRLRGLEEVHEAHVRGFFSLQVGAFDEAREHYGAIVRADSTDLYARVMLGEIELLDPWSVRDAAGSLVTRSNLNAARRAFVDAVRIDPTFELAYGQMFAIQRELEGTLHGGCDGFEETTDAVRPIWQPQVPTERMYPLCLVASDSLQWIPYAEYLAMDRARLRAGADRYFRQAVGELERWASFAPEQPRPLELLSEAYLLQRGQLGVAAPERHRALAAEALRYRSEAVGLKPDTSLADLVALANLEMAAGDPEAAVDLARSALLEVMAPGPEGGVEPPPELANVLVASGQVGAALEVVSRLQQRSTIPARYVRDPEDGRSIPIAGAEQVLRALEVLGASGVSGRLINDGLEQLESAWASQGLSSRERQVVQNQVTRDIMASLALDSVAMARWRKGTTLEDPIWVALSLSETEPTSAAQAFADLQRTPSRFERHQPTLTLAIAAVNLGLDERALALLSRLDSIPASVDRFDQGWGLQVLSHFLRATYYERLGDDRAAAQHYRTFLEARSWPDSLSRPLLDEARGALGLIQGS